MIRQQQTIRTYKRPRATIVQPHAREPKMIEPGLRWMKVILRRQLLQWRVIEGPHALFGADRGRHRQHCRGSKYRSTSKESCKHEFLTGTILKSATTNSTSTRQQPANGPVTSDAVRFLALPIMLTGSQLPVCIQLL